jgi:flavin-binding protein dodecin
MTDKERERIAEDVVRRADTVTLLTCDEVVEIYKRVRFGEFDDYKIEVLPK